MVILEYAVMHNVFLTNITEKICETLYKEMEDKSHITDSLHFFNNDLTTIIPTYLTL